MAKYFEFKFSEKSKTCQMQDEKGVISQYSVAETEKKVLKNIFHIAGMHQKEIGKYLQCKDCISQIDNLKDDSILLLTEQDIDFIKEGFEKTAGNRPFFWIEHCESIFRQIKSPVEHKE